MRIALVHSFYSSAEASGENQVVCDELAVLKAAGFEVRLFAARMDASEGGALYALGSGLRVATGRGRSPKRALDDWSPDVVHIHNLFPNFGRKWVEDIEVPVVHTLHNYRPLCSNATLYRDSDVCMLCPQGHRLAALRFRCYRDSLLATLPLVIAGAGHPESDPLLRRADRLLALSELQRAIFIDAGLPSHRLQVAPNFLPDSVDPGPQLDPGEGFIGVGRLSPEKGFAALVANWPSDQELTLVGDGPERGIIEGLGHPSVRLVGHLPRPEALHLIGRSRALVFPSQGPEPFGLVAIEALASGTPVVARSGTSHAAMLRQNGAGAVTDGDDWAGALQSLATGTLARARAREAFQRAYSERAFVASRRLLYEELSEAT